MIRNPFCKCGEVRIVYMRMETQVYENDVKLLSDISSRTPEVLDDIISRYLASVSRISYRILCDRMDSESVTLALFTMIWNEPQSFNGTIPIDHMVVRRTCSLCRHRLLRRKFLRLFSINPEVYISAVPVVPGAEDFISRQAWTLYCRTVENYSDRQRVVFSLCELEGYTAGQAAEIIGIGVSRVNKDLEEARNKLRDELDYFGRMNDYSLYIGFLRKVRDQLTDTIRLQRCISASLLHIGSC